MIKKILSFLGITYAWYSTRTVAEVAKRKLAHHREEVAKRKLAADVADREAHRAGNVAARIMDRLQ